MVVVENKEQEVDVPLVNWKTWRAQRSAARRTGMLESFKASAIAGPNIWWCVARAEWFIYKKEPLNYHNNTKNKVTSEQ